MKVLRLNSSTFPMTSEEHREYQQAGVEVVCRETVNESQDSGLLRDVDALAIVSAKARGGLISCLEKCKVISRYGNGIDNVDVSAATSCGIVVTNVPDFCVSELADHTLALLLGLARKLLIMDRCTRTGAWQARIEQPVRRVAGKTLGLVGFGRTAQEISRRAVTFDLCVVATDPCIDSAACVRLGVKPVSFADLLENSDFVSLHVPLTPNTFHLIGEPELRRMKTSAFLINTARGAAVDEGALVKALEEGWIAGAGLDVYENLGMFDLNPRIPDHPLFKMQNIILTPHSGGCSVESLEELYLQGARHVVIVLTEGKWPPHCVNPQVVPRISLV
jgi:D-3-phosphoglycerate dehydrogenase / 2-oxoglutarate reductase